MLEERMLEPRPRGSQREALQRREMYQRDPGRTRRPVWLLITEGGNRNEMMQGPTGHGEEFENKHIDKY